MPLTVLRAPCRSSAAKVCTLYNCAMAIFDRFRSRQDHESARDKSTIAPQEVLHDQPSKSRPLGEELRDVSASSSSVPAAFSTDDTPKFYNPYEGLSAAVDNRSMRGGYKLPQQPEFLFSEEATVHRRGWGENLTYYTGTGYLSGWPTASVMSVQLSKCGRTSSTGVFCFQGLSLVEAKVWSQLAESGLKLALTLPGCGSIGC